MTQSRKKSKLKELELMTMILRSKRLKWPKNGSKRLLTPPRDNHRLYLKIINKHQLLDWNCRSSIFLRLLGNTLGGLHFQTHSSAPWTAIVRLVTTRNSTVSVLRWNMSLIFFYRIYLLLVRITKLPKKLLQDRYANKREIVHTHLEAIYDFRLIKEESPDQLRKLISNLMENTMALQGMGLDVGPSDIIWVHIIA